MVTCEDKKLFYLPGQSFLTYLSGTILFVGLRKDEEVGLDLLRSESESETGNQHEPVKFWI